MTWPLGTPYAPENANGYWGVPTSTIDWCEENYVVSPYIAEAINTTTNAAFVLLALYSLVNIVRYNFELRFLLSSIGFALVGTGSWLFHMTLRYEYQLLDELPMIYATCIPCWSVFQYGKSQSQSAAIGASIALAALLLTAVYLWLQNPTIHQTAYGLLNATVIIKSVMQTRSLVRDEQARRDLHKTLLLGLLEFGSGYVLWNLDIHLCGFWRRLRRDMGMPWGFFLEGHGWWHLLTGLGVYNYLVYLQYQRTFLVGINDQYKYTWKFGFLPVVEPRKPESAAVAAGAALKQKSS